MYQLTAACPKLGRHQAKGARNKGEVLCQLDGLLRPACDLVAGNRDAGALLHATLMQATNDGMHEALARLGEFEIVCGDYVFSVHRIQ